MDELAIIDPQAYPPDPPQFTVHRLFIGDDGLRAGWSFLLFLVILVVLALGANAVIRHFHLLPKRSDATAQLGPRVAAIGDALQFSVVALAALIMSFLERRPFSRYGLTARRMIPDFLSGLGWGLLLLSSLVGALYAVHAIAFDGFALRGSVAIRYALKWALAFLFVGLAEEFITRGYIQFTVSRGVAGIVRTMDAQNRYSHAIGFWVAAFLFSVCLFMSGHLGNSGETFWGIAAVGVAGTVFAFSLWRTGSLWWAIGIHTSWDWAQTCFYGTADSGITAAGHILSTHPIGRAWLSGGTTGPEGSILVIPTLLVIALIIHLTLPRRDYPLTTDQSESARQIEPNI